MQKVEIRNFRKHFEIRVLRRNSPIFFSNERSMVIPTYVNLVYVSIVLVFVLFLHLTICWWTQLVPRIDIVIVKKLVRTIYSPLKSWKRGRFKRFSLQLFTFDFTSWSRPWQDEKIQIRGWCKYFYDVSCCDFKFGILITFKMTFWKNYKLLQPDLVKYYNLNWLFHNEQIILTGFGQKLQRKSDSTNLDVAKR